MDHEGKPTTPDAPSAEELAKTSIRIEMEYTLANNRLMVRSQAPTLMMEGVLIDVLTKGLVDKLQNDPKAPMAPDGVVRVTVLYDMAADKHALSAQAPRVVVKGVLQHALGEIMGYQLRQREQVLREQLEKRILALEERVAAPKIILPGGLS